MFGQAVLMLLIVVGVPTLITIAASKRIAETAPKKAAQSVTDEQQSRL